MREPALRWLYSELPELTAAGILSEDAARRIRDHYGPVPEGGRTNLVTAVLGTIGAVLIGAGVLLLVAHNWDQISRGGRTALVMALLLGAQAGATSTATKPRTCSPGRSRLQDPPRIACSPRSCQLTGIGMFSHDLQP